jgi:hypothetical protein
MKEEGRIRQPFEVEAKARLDLLESASPPPGYEINRVLLMTYGLDAGVALAILACTHGVAQRDIDIDSGNFDLPKMEQSRFIKKVLNRTLILAQQSDSAPRRIENIRSDLGELLQDRFLSIAKPRKSTTGKSPWINFHPKLAIFTFQRGSDAILRILIGSKNLTLGSALESAVQLEFRAKMNLTDGEKDQGMARVPGGSRVLNSLSHYLSQVLEKGISESHHDTKLIMRHVQEVKNWVAELKRFAKTHKHIFVVKFRPSPSFAGTDHVA